MSILIKFRHGLGDAVQLTAVLKHLRQYRPDWKVDVASLIGKHSAFNGLCRRTFASDRERVATSLYQRVFDLDWHECQAGYGDVPSTKVVRCLREVFGLDPRPELCSYTINIGAAATERAKSYLQGVAGAARPDGRFPIVFIHYQGNTSGKKKDLPNDLAKELCALVRGAGHVPVILDWDRRSPLPDGVNVHCPHADHEIWGGTGTGDAETLAALIENSALMIGIDSGPLHVAGATSTPTVGIWTQHHPIHYFDLADNVVHLVPQDHERHAAGAAAVTYFENNYRHRVYRSLTVELLATVQSLLTGVDVEQAANRQFLSKLRSTSYGASYYQEHKEAGLDYLDFGGWQQGYGRWFVETLKLQGKKVLDVGCACGSILRGLGQAGAIVQGVELNEHMIQLGREKWPDMAPLLHVCDAVNLHLFEDKSWDAIHTAQVAEHWKPELVPFILRELRRVTNDGGLLFCALDTSESFARQGRAIDKNEDPTHVCVKPMAWWHEQLAQAGWKVATGKYDGSLRKHRESYLRRYDWDWFMAERA